MIRNQQSTAEVHGVIGVGERRVQVDLTLSRGVRAVTKRMRVNGQRPQSRADLSEALPVTVFTPEGVDMIRHGPEGRRHFLETLLTDVDLRAGETVERFERVLRQRNALLRGALGEILTPSERAALDAWTEDFVHASQALLIARRRIATRLTDLVTEHYRELSGEATEVGLHYETSWKGDLGPALAAALPQDRSRGYCTVGPHRDDLRLTLGGRDARRQASQGEQRSLALALRLAGHELVHRERGVRPLLLLDDVFSELDSMRSERLLKLLPAGQTLMSTAGLLPASIVPATVVALKSMHEL
jgi:DNA replication and repair protein RecF